jgi:colanic acid biosynthesis protein WcaH
LNEETVMTLGERDFLEVVERTPLVSIDLVVQDRAGRVLLGRRTREPAKNTWFVPGGRIRKNETLDAAFSRITAAELGAPLARSQARLLGVYTHLYETNFAEAAGIGTHYVVLAMRSAWMKLFKACPRSSTARIAGWTPPRRCAIRKCIRMCCRIFRRFQNRAVR